MNFEATLEEVLEEAISSLDSTIQEIFRKRKLRFWAACKQAGLRKVINITKADKHNIIRFSLSEDQQWRVFSDKDNAACLFLICEYLGLGSRSYIHTKLCIMRMNNNP